MKKKNILIIIITVLVIAATVFTLIIIRKNNSLPSSEIKGNTIRFGVLEGVNPFSYIGDDGTFYGYNCDIAKSIANDLGYENCEFISVTPNNAYDMLRGGNVDVLINNICKGDEENVLYTRAYLTSNLVTVRQKDDSVYLDRETLYNMSCALQGGSEAEKIYKTFEFINPATSYLTVYDALTAVKNGNAQFALMDDCVAIKALKDTDSYGNLQTDIMFEPQDYVMATRGSDEKLCNSINAVILKFKQNDYLKVAAIPYDIQYYNEDY